MKSLADLTIDDLGAGSDAFGVGDQLPLPRVQVSVVAFSALGDFGVSRVCSATMVVLRHYQRDRFEVAPTRIWAYAGGVVQSNRNMGLSPLHGLNDLIDARWVAHTLGVRLFVVDHQDGGWWEVDAAETNHPNGAARGPLYLGQGWVALGMEVSGG